MAPAIAHHPLLISNPSHSFPPLPSLSNPRSHFRPLRSTCLVSAAISNPTTASPKARLSPSPNWKDLWSLNSWVVRDYYRLVASVNAFDPRIRSLSDEQLSAKTAEFRARLARGETLADIQAEAFAVVREAAVRKLGMRHYDVQIIGGAVLHDGCIAEMKTGEGKTLVSTLAAYLNALTGCGVHGGDVKVQMEIDPIWRRSRC